MFLAKRTEVAAAASGGVTIEAALQQARASVPFLEARALLCHAVELTPAQLLAKPQQQLTPGQDENFRALIARRAAGDPIAYLIGSREFFGLEFKVTRDVLIPRPETELLVEIALEKIPDKENRRVLDLGTGCGNIAISLALARPLATVTAVDISEAALEIARENCALFTPSPTLPPRGGGRGWGGVRFMRSDWFSALERETYDVIAANPPYVAEHDPHLCEGDLRFEPTSALVSGQDGLNAIRRIVSEARHRLKPNGWLLFEHGYDQGAACAALLGEHGYDDVFSESDLAGIPRVAGGRLTGPPRRS